MKLYAILLSLFLAFSSFAQTPASKWTEYPSLESGDQVVFDVKPTKDMGFIKAGVNKTELDSRRILLDLIAYYGRPWLVKLDSRGKKQWFHV
jgi:hypothetical protein